jgi:hypothetical protein
MDDRRQPRLSAAPSTNQHSECRSFGGGFFTRAQSATRAEVGRPAARCRLTEPLRCREPLATCRSRSRARRFWKARRSQRRGRSTNPASCAANRCRAMHSPTHTCLNPCIAALFVMAISLAAQSAGAQESTARPGARPASPSRWSAECSKANGVPWIRCSSPAKAGSSLWLQHRARNGCFGPCARCRRAGCVCDRSGSRRTRGHGTGHNRSRRLSHSRRPFLRAVTGSFADTSVVLATASPSIHTRRFVNITSPLPTSPRSSPDRQQPVRQGTPDLRRHH